MATSVTNWLKSNQLCLEPKLERKQSTKEGNVSKGKKSSKLDSELHTSFYSLDPIIPKLSLKAIPYKYRDLWEKNGTQP